MNLFPLDNFREAQRNGLSDCAWLLRSEGVAASVFFLPAASD